MSGPQARNEAARRRARIRLMQKYLINPPSKALAFLGLLPGHIVLETVGRKTGERRRTVVGAQREGSTLWIVAEQGRHAGYVRNLLDRPRVRVRTRGRWLDGRADVLPGDDVDARLASFDDQRHAGMVRRFGTALMTVRIELDEPDRPR
ncbi:nitroreductase/quinone reductase family protein [Streptomyces sp. GC420]|uniref:nitroreductase/quinone reductase family protein n=1 Tax=Streptomyces sp. GC420 TaxID=2697568 RepID=UPI001414FA52|nr:nitroreductase/quinone reductase family protein [Streptomyces sp. GC420]NBM16256.1 nitroreductase family deazaflavin-dependent oxidoreductase [Streptomyces sp. GC420]